MISTSVSEGGGDIVTAPGDIAPGDIAPGDIALVSCASRGGPASEPSGARQLSSRASKSFTIHLAMQKKYTRDRGKPKCACLAFSGSEPPSC